MSKLFNLKKWLTIDEAAKHLSGVFSESVSSGDVLRLGLDRHLTLSVNFVNHALAKVGHIVSVAEAIRLPGVPENNKLGHFQFPGFMLSEEEVLEFDETTETLIGVFDLPLLGGDRLDVEQVYQMFTNGPDVTLQEPHGTFVQDSKGRYCQIQELMSDFDSPIAYSPSPGKKLVKIPQNEEKGQWSGQRRRVIWKEIVIAQSTEDFHYPAASLPGDSVLVVRLDSLMEFIQSVNGTPATIEKQLSTKERVRLLKMVIGMAVSGYSYAPAAAKSNVPNEIVDDIVAAGMSIDVGTVRKYLREAIDTVLPAKSLQS
jgi:hypothetical protein